MSLVCFSLINEWITYPSSPLLLSKSCLDYVRIRYMNYVSPLWTILTFEPNILISYTLLIFLINEWLTYPKIKTHHIFLIISINFSLYHSFALVPSMLVKKQMIKWVKKYSSASCHCDNMLNQHFRLLLKHSSYAITACTLIKCRTFGKRKAKEIKEDRTTSNNLMQIIKRNSLSIKNCI